MIPDLIQPTEEILEMVNSKLTNLNEVIHLLDSKCRFNTINILN